MTYKKYKQLCDNITSIISNVKYIKRKKNIDDKENFTYRDHLQRGKNRLVDEHHGFTNIYHYGTAHGNCPASSYYEDGDHHGYHYSNCHQNYHIGTGTPLHNICGHGPTTFNIDEIP
jgi:hypothetical protein